MEEQQEQRLEMAAVSRIRVREEPEAHLKNREVASLDVVVDLVAVVVPRGVERQVWQKEKEVELEKLAVDWEWLESENWIRVAKAWPVRRAVLKILVVVNRKARQEVQEKEGVQDYWCWKKSQDWMPKDSETLDQALRAWQTVASPLFSLAE